ncbi:MAG: UMP kinase [Bacteroidales bacterium]|nr:UMP kinase [Bacteroidales bacterium]MDY0315194.1 UMP kinase [Bacteroidales bacterium]NLB86677.1 UMP kinase [Bacteroidales bacterium]
MLKYKRILLKLSGESLAGEKKQGFDEARLLEYAEQIKAIYKKGVQIGIVIGGGNIFRGLTGSAKGFDRVKGDQMGMLATVINSLALQSALESLGVKTKVFTSMSIASIGEKFAKPIVMQALESNCVCVLSGGTGNPYFSTDTASALRAIEIEAEVFLKGTRVDGVYTDDPEKNPDAKKIDLISFDEVYEKNLKVMDLTSFTLCKENNMPVIVFDMDTKGNLEKLISGEKIGSLIKNKIN